MQVFGCVLEQSIASVVILHGEESDALEATPAEGDDHRIPRLQDPLVPAVLLESHLHNTGDRPLFYVCAS